MKSAILSIVLLSIAAAWSQSTPVADTTKSGPAATSATTSTASPLVAANALMSSGKFDDAAEAFRAIVDKDPALAEMPKMASRRL